MKIAYVVYPDFTALDLVGPDLTRNGEVVITGRTDSPNFPVANASQATLSGDIDAFVSKLR
jgi:hypothetical protein